MQLEKSISSGIQGKKMGEEADINIDFMVGNHGVHGGK